MIFKNFWKIFKKYNGTWDKIKNLFGKMFDSEPVHNDKQFKIKINSYNTYFYSKKTPTEGKHYTYFPVKLFK